MFQPAPSITFRNAAAVLNDGLQAIAAGQTTMDLGSLAEVDSSAIATLLAWKRAASKNRGSLSFLNVPTNLQSLAHLYGVDDLLLQ